MNLNQTKRQARISLKQGAVSVIALIIIAAISLFYANQMKGEGSEFGYRALIVVAGLLLGVGAHVSWLLWSIKKDLRELEELEAQELDALSQDLANEFEKQLKLSANDRSGPRQKNRRA